MYLISKKHAHLYRNNIGCVVIKKNSIFVAKRVGYHKNAWQMPQGGVDENENFEEALYRELLEEIGTNNVTILQESEYYRYYKVPTNIATNIWGGKYIGQKQKWFLLQFNGEDNEINIHTKKPEFEAWKWSDAESTVKQAVFFKKDIYLDVLSEFQLI